MVDKIDPTNQTSVEYGQSLLGRKYKQEEQYKKDSKKDARIGYATQILSGVDNLLKQRYERNIAERNAGLDQLIIQEKAEYNSLQKEFDSQAEYREASSPMFVAREKANAELLSKYGDISNLPLDNQTRIDFYKSQKELTKFHYDRYIKNKVSMPYDTAEEYTAELEALKNKRVPSGLMDSILRTTGLRKENAREALDTELSTQRAAYKGRLADREGVTGGIDDLTDEMKAVYLGAPLPSPDVTTEKFVTIPNGRGENISLIAVTTKDALGNTKITGARSATGEVIPMSQFVGVTKKQAQASLTEAQTKILSMKGNEDLNPRGVQQYIYDNPKEFPNLAVHMKVHGLHLPRIKAFGSEDNMSVKALSAVGNLEKDPVYKEYYKSMNKDQLNSLQGGILQSIEWYNNHGIKGKDGQIGFLESAQILQIAQAEQLQGLKNISDWGTPLVTYDMVQPGSLSTSFENKSDALFTEKLDGSFESTAPKDGKAPPQFEDLQPKEEDTADTLRSKGTHIINKLVASPEFDNASFTERRSYVEKIEKKYGIEFDVPYNLLNPSATPMVDEVDDVAEQVAALRGERPEGVQLELTGNDSFDAARAGDEMVRESLNRDLPAQDSKNLEDRDKEMLNPSRPEFKELTTKEKAQQNKEEREASTLKRKEKREAATLKRKEKRDSSSSDVVKERQAKEKEIFTNMEDSMKNFLSNDPEINRLKMYAKGTLNKNPTISKTLIEYGLEDLTRKELGIWLQENTDSLRSRATKGVKTKYSPKDIRKELDDGNPVFIGDPRTGKRYEVNN